MAGETSALHIPSTASALPAAWTWKRLDKVCEGVFDCPHSTPVLSDVGPYLARSQDMRSGVLRADQAARVSETTYSERIARAEPRHGDILYSREGTYFGIAAEVPSGVRLCLGQRMVLIRPNPSIVHPRFLRYWLNSPALSLHTAGHRDGTVAERLKSSDNPRPARCSPPAFRTTRHRPQPRHARRQARAEPPDERDAGGYGTSLVQVVVRGLQSRAGESGRS